MANEDFNFEYEGEDNGSGQFWIDEFNDDFQKIRVCSQVLREESSSVIHGTVSNNILLRDFPFILKVEQGDVDSGQLILQNYHKSLQDVVNENPEAIVKLNGSLTDYGTRIVVRLFNIFTILYESRVSYKCWSEEEDAIATAHIVFLEEDENCEIPYLLPIPYSSDQSQWKHNFESLSILIESTASTTDLWLDDFLTQLKHTSIIIEKLQRHPIFWRPWDIQNFVLRVRNLAMRIGNNVYPKGLYGWYANQLKYVDWISNVKEDAVLQDFYYDSTQFSKSKYVNKLYSLVKFMRNGFIHYNDEAVWKAYMNGNFAILEEKAKLAGELEDHLISLYSDFILELYKFMWKIVMNDGRENGNEWGPHSAMRGVQIFIPGEV